jgi:hypothetical protein
VIADNDRAGKKRHLANHENRLIVMGLDCSFHISYDFYNIAFWPVAGRQQRGDVRETG